MKTIKVYDVKHAVEIIFADNLETKFEEQVISVPEEISFGEVIEANNITLDDLINFLNNNSKDENYIKG